MDKKTKFKYQVILGSVIIVSIFFLSFKYLMRGPAFIKVLAIGLVIGSSYLVVDYLMRINKSNKNE